MMANEFCLKHMTFPRPWPYDYPGVTRPDLGGLRGGRSFFEELRLGEAPPLGGEAAWAAWQAELWPALERTALLPHLLLQRWCVRLLSRRCPIARV